MLPHFTFTWWLARSGDMHENKLESDSDSTSVLREDEVSSCLFLLLFAWLGFLLLCFRKEKDLIIVWSRVDESILFTGLLFMVPLELFA
jgi:hypothetical protein